MSRRIAWSISDAKTAVRSLMLASQDVEGNTASEIMRWVKRLENDLNDIEQEIKILERADRERRP